MRNIVEIIGVQRFLKLLVLLAINGMLAAGIYYYILPEAEASEKEYKAVKNDVIRLRGDINSIEERLAQLKANEKQYDRLLKRGFMSGQDRLDIQKVIDDMRQRSGVRTLTYNISPIKIVEHDHAYALDYDLIKSNVSVDATSLLDLEVLALQAMMNEEFLGQTVIEKISYHRTNPLTQENLVKVGTGQVVDFMRGEIDFGWYTLSEKKSLQEGGL